MIDDPLGNKTIASIDADYFKKLLPKTVTGRSALDAAASEIDRQIASVEAEQRKLLQQSQPSSHTSMRAFSPGKDGVDPLAFLAGGAAGGPGSNPWDAVRNTINGYDQLAFSDKDRLYQEFLKQEAARTGKSEVDIKMATADTAPKEPSRSGLDLPTDILAGLGAGTAGMGKTIVDLAAPESDLSKSLGQRVDTLNSMQSEVEQNSRREIQAEVERFKKEHPDASPLELFAAEAKATAGNLSVGTAANLAGGMAAGMGAAGKVAKAAGAARAAQLAAAGATAAEAASAGAAAGAAAGTAVGAGVEGLTTAGEVRGGVYEQVMNIPLSDPNLQGNPDFQKYLTEARGDNVPNSPTWSPLQEYQAQRTAREKLALDSRGAAALAGVAGAALSAFGPEKAFAQAAARRAAAEATGSAVGVGTKLLDNALVKVPVSATAEGLTEVAPTAATNVNMQNVDPTRGVLEGAGGDFVLGALGGVGGEGASVALERATDLSARARTPGAPAPGAPAPAAAPTPSGPSAEAGARITPVPGENGTGYNVRQVDDTVVHIPAGPDAQTEAELIAQQAQDEFDSLGTTTGGGTTPTTIDAFNTQLVMQPDGTMNYAPGAAQNAEADQFINQARQQATGGEPAPAAAQPAEAVPAPATAPVAAETPVVTREMVNEQALQAHEMDRINRLRADENIATGTTDSVMELVRKGELDPIVSGLFKELNAAGWLGYNTPAVALDAVLFPDPSTPIPPAIEAAARVLRQQIRNAAQSDLETNGLPRDLHDMIGQAIPAPAAGAAQNTLPGSAQENVSAPAATGTASDSLNTEQRNFYQSEINLLTDHLSMVDENPSTRVSSVDREFGAGVGALAEELQQALIEAGNLGYSTRRQAFQAALNNLTADGSPVPTRVASAAAAIRTNFRRLARVRNPSVVPLDRPTAEDLPAEVPTLTETVDANGIPLTGPLTQQQATEANNAINTNLFLDEIRNDIRLTLEPAAVMRLAANGNAFSRELSNLLRGLNSENWLGKATPAEAVRFAIGDTEIPTGSLPVSIAAAAQMVRARAIDYGRQRTRDRGIRHVLQGRVASTLSSRRSTTPTGPAQPGVQQAPATPLRELNLDDAKVKELAAAIQPFARVPLGEVPSLPDRGIPPTPTFRKTFFMRAFKKLLEDQGYSIVPGGTPANFRVRSPSGAEVEAHVVSNGNDGHVIKTTTTGFTAGSKEGAPYYSALNAAAVAAGIPLYNGTYTPVNYSRLPVNRLKAILQVLGASDATVTDAAKYLGMRAGAIGAETEYPLNTFKNIAQHVIQNAEKYFPNATASNMYDGANGANYLSGVLRLNPDGTFDTPAGVMTSQELQKYTRVNNEGEPRYASNLSTAFGASSYSSMALAATLRSYMEATTDEQRAQLQRAVAQISNISGQDSSGNATRPFAYLDVTDPTIPQPERSKSPAVGDIITPKGRGYAAVVKSLVEARNTGVLPKETANLALALLKQNPAIANDLSVFADPKGDGAGGYGSVDKIIALFSSANPLSGVHEILHHTERMLPPVVRAGLLKAYNAALAKAMKTATPEQKTAITQLIKDASGLGGDGSAARMQQVFSDGTLNYGEHYQLAHPSEFWAVNASKLFAGQQGKTGWRAKARAWLQGFVQKAKSILGLPNDNAVLQGLKSVLKADGSFVSNLMLAQDNGRLVPVFLDVPSTGDRTQPGTINTTGDQAAPNRRGGFDEILGDIQNRVPPPAASPERSLAQALSRSQNTAPGQATRAIDARLQRLGEAFHDHLGPVERLFTDIGDQSPELRAAGVRATGAMRAAPGIRDNVMRQMIDDHGGNEMFTALEQIARTQGLTLEATVRDVGLWLTAKRAPTANARLIARDTREVEQASQQHTRTEQALKTARDTAGTPIGTLNQLEADNVGAARRLAAATRQLALRTQAVNNPNATNVRRHVAGVGGFNNAQAAAMVASIEQHIPREMLQQVAEHVYDLNAFRIVTDLESGRAEPAVVAQFLDRPEIEPLLQQLVNAARPDAQDEQGQANRDALRAQVMTAVRSDYVPLTGNPQSALYEDAPSGGATQPNTGRTYQMEGRQDSVPDDGITATMGGLIRSASHAGWAPFQDRVAELYDQMTPAQRNEFGIHRSTRQLTDRSTGSSNAALVRLRGDTEQRFEFSDKKILDAIHNETIADTDASLGKIAKATRAYAWAATQFAPWFAPRNMVRDFGERADMLLSRELHDEQGNRISSPSVVKAMLGYGTVGLPRVLNAGLRFVLNGTAGGRSLESRYLRELQDSGSLSIYGSRFQQSRLDFIKQLKSARTINQRMRALNHYTVELWNRPFDFAAPLASYIAMREKGVAKEQAQAIALDMMNFRKRGTQMKTIGAFLPFAQTGVTGGVNMAKSLADLRNGKMKPYAVARITGYMLALSALRAMFMAAADDDEGGNKLAQLPQYEHENNILIPFDTGVAKIPLPFGLMRLANSLVNNTLSYASNDMSGGQALSNMVMGGVVPAFAPISESPIDGSKYPIQKFIMTFAPPIIKPVVQAGMGMTAFGAPLKNEYAKKDQFISDQPKLNTPAAYTTMAQAIRQWTGADVPPEVVREIVKGYPLGALNYARSTFLEKKPLNTEAAKAVFTPYPDAARYFQFKAAEDDASTELKKMERGDSNYDAAKIKWLKEYNKQEDKVQGQISSISKSKGMSDAAKAERKDALRAERSKLQNAALYKWRTDILKAEAEVTK